MGSSHGYEAGVSVAVRGSHQIVYVQLQRVFIAISARLQLAQHFVEATKHVDTRI